MLIARSRFWLYALLLGVLFVLQAEIALIWVFVVLGCFWFFTGLPTWPKDHMAVGCYAWFLLVLLLSCFHSHFVSRTLLVWLRYAFLLLVSLDLMYRLGDEEREKLFGMVVGVGWLMGLGGIYQVFISEVPQPLSWALGSEVLLKRAFGLFDNPNLFGTFLMLLFVPALKRALEAPATGWRLSTAFFGLLLLLSQSRGAILATLLGLALLMIFEKGRPRKLLAWVFGLLLLGFLVTGRAASLKKVDLGVNQRVELYVGIRLYLQRHWLGGTGPGTFHLVYPGFRTVGGYYPLSAHNHLLETWCESGLGGVILLGGFVVLLGILLWRQGRDGVWPLAMLLMCLANSMTNQSFGFFNLCLLAVLSMLALRPCLPEMEDAPARFRQWLLGLPLALALILGWYEGFKHRLLRRESPLTNPKQLPWPANRDVELALATAEWVLAKGEDRQVLEMLGWLKEMDSLYPYEGEIPWAMGRLYRRQKQSGNAKIMFQMALQRDGLSERYGLDLLRSLYNEKKWDRLVELARKLLQSNPGYRRINPLYDSIQVFLVRGLVATGRLPEVRELLSRGLWVNEHTKKQLEENLARFLNKPSAAAPVENNPVGDQPAGGPALPVAPGAKGSSVVPAQGGSEPGQ